jgi:hypothetical protein
MPKQIWTGEIRRVLYQRLVQEFGPSWEWKRASSPGGDLDAKYETFCKVFAEAIGATSARAVEMQVRFALPESGDGSVWEGHAQTAILNKAAALEAGFIKDSQLPNLLAVGRTKPE